MAYVEASVPRVVQEGADGDANPGYIKAIVDGTTIGFKYFDVKGATGLRIKTRAYFDGDFEVRTSLDGEVLGKIHGVNSNMWESNECTFDAPLTGVHALYLTYCGTGTASLKSIEFLH